VDVRGVCGGGGIDKWNQAFRQFSLQILTTTTANTSTTNLMIKTLNSANSINAVLSFPKSCMYMTLAKECAFILLNGLFPVMLSCGHLYTNVISILQSIFGNHS
jgi:hypothetical protein